MTLHQQIRCAEREVALRIRVYPRFIRQKRMTEEKAIYEMQTMQQIVNTLKALEKDESPRASGTPL